MSQTASYLLDAVWLVNGNNLRVHLTIPAFDYLPAYSYPVSCPYWRELRFQPLLVLFLLELITIVMLLFNTFQSILVILIISLRRALSATFSFFLVVAYATVAVMVTSASTRRVTFIVYKGFMVHLLFTTPPPPAFLCKLWRWNGKIFFLIWTQTEAVDSYHSCCDCECIPVWELLQLWIKFYYSILFAMIV